MIVLWRLYRARYGPGLDGAGGMFAEGRWHSLGSRVVYFGGSAAIVALERLAHTFSGKPVRRVEEIAALAPNWTRMAQSTREAGDAWLRGGSSCLLTAPSAILPEESNFVFNPRHRDAGLLRMIGDQAFHVDSRLL
jgi:RES domain-containing protein